MKVRQEACEQEKMGQNGRFPQMILDPRKGVGSCGGLLTKTGV